MQKKFCITLGKGFQIVIGNRVLSVQWGNFNYCEKSKPSMPFNEPKEHDFWDSDTAEISIMDNLEDKNWITKEIWEAVFDKDPSDDVVGHVTTDEVAQIIKYLYDNPRIPNGS